MLIRVVVPQTGQEAIVEVKVRRDEKACWISSPGTPYGFEVEADGSAAWHSPEFEDAEGAVVPVRIEVAGPLLVKIAATMGVEFEHPSGVMRDLMALYRGVRGYG